MLLSETDSVLHESIPSQRLSRSDVHFPLTTPRKRNPSIPILSHTVTEDGQSSGIPRIRRDSNREVENSEPVEEVSDLKRETEPASTTQDEQPRPVEKEEDDASSPNLQDLPEEIQKRILDYIFGDMRPVNAASSSTGLSHRMRHPRRKAVSELALISPEMRFMVQERIYRHIKIKGTKTGLRDSQVWFQEHPHLAGHVRHIEYWVPVWGDKASQAAAITQMHHQTALLDFGNDLGDFAHEYPGGLQFKLSTYSATLDQIFDHLGGLFPNSSIFTLEGGHCKNSNKIKHFKANLFGQYMHQQLRVLPNIKVFAMRGAWNIMRDFSDWKVIQAALPCLSEWHCGYAKPRTEAYATINEILIRLPLTLRHVDISLDSMFSKDEGVLGSMAERKNHHVCEQLGWIAPRLESLSFTGKICERFWTAARDVIEFEADKGRMSTLRSLSVVVKTCCRQRIESVDPVTGDVLVEEIGGVMADSAGIGNLVFINAFERLVSGTIDGLGMLPTLSTVKIRYIDLDSPCQQLNPYWNLEDGVVTGIWNEHIVERLTQVRPDVHYEKLEDGIGGENSAASAAKKEADDVWEGSWTRTNVAAYVVGMGAAGAGGDRTGASALYPRTIPRGINTASYKVVSEARTVN